MTAAERRRLRMRRCGPTVLAAIALATSTAAHSAILSGEKAVVLDGDTVRLGLVSVRLYGIDAPETGRRCGPPEGGRWSCDEAATDRLAEPTEGREVR